MNKLTPQPAAFSLLLARATPVLEIIGLDRNRRWTRPMKDPKDPRVGPWYGSVHKVLDQRTWKAPGECLYFVTDGEGTLKYVGESKNRLGDRWKTPPARCATTGRELGNPFMFHSQAWPAIETETSAYGGSGLRYLVSVLPRPALLRAVEEVPGLVHLKSTATEKVHLARQVEQWFCRQPAGASLWNIQWTDRAGMKRPRAASSGHAQSGRTQQDADWVGR